MLLRRRSGIIEIFYRAMYLVFLFYAGVVISAGLLAAVAMIGQIFTGNLRLESWMAGVGAVVLLWMLGAVRDFWADHFELYRMDDAFSGAQYLERHLDHPLWPKVAELLKLAEDGKVNTMDREEARRAMCAMVRNNCDLYEAVFELGDERMRWALVNFR